MVVFDGCRTNITQSRLDFSPNKKIQKIKKTQILIPRNYAQNQPENKELNTNFYSLELYARQFVHGDVIYVELVPAKEVHFDQPLKITVNGTNLHLKQSVWGYRGFFAIHPENENREVKLEVNFILNGNHISQIHAFQLDEKQFPVSTSAMNVGKFSRTDIPVNKDLQERIQKEYKMKEIIFNQENPEILTGILSHPRNFHQLTSPFYEKRVYEQYEIQQGKKIEHKPKISFHRGLDFYARKGDPIFAMGSGKVVLAESMYYEGNCVMIDHGNRILSIYMHMSKINVEPDKIVKPGDLIGFAGSTGISTGAHLHVSLYVNGIPADPLSLLYLPIRD